jgi:hypothetical protein
VAADLESNLPVLQKSFVDVERYVGSGREGRYRPELTIWKKVAELILDRQSQILA